jgi:hypothetical protein
MLRAIDAAERALAEDFETAAGASRCSSSRRRSGTAAAAGTIRLRRSLSSRRARGFADGAALGRTTPLRRQPPHCSLAASVC